MQYLKPKLLFIVTQGEFGGAQRYIFDIAEAVRDTYDVVVATGQSKNQELIEKCTDLGIRTHQFINLVREINPVKDVAAIFEIARFLKKEKPDTVHLNSSKVSFVGALSKMLLQITGFKFHEVYTAHGWVFNEPLSLWRKKFYLQLERFAAATHDKVIVLSEHDYDTARKNKICGPEKLVIIPHSMRPIDFLNRAEARRYLESRIMNHEAAIWIGTIANLYKTKGITYLIDAAILLKKDGIVPNFIIIGEGKERKTLESKIKNGELKNIFLVGALKDAARYLNAFDIFVLPSIKEGMPYALLEAMQAELPIVASCVGAIPEMIEHEKNSLLVPPKDAVTLAAYIKKLCADELLRKSYGMFAHEAFIKKFDFNTMIEKTREVYREIQKCSLIRKKEGRSKSLDSIQ